MGFNTGDRVHITRFGHKEVNFYATLTNFYFNSNAKTAELFNCSNKTFEGDNVYLPNDECFGPDKADYYTLVADEEDSEKPEVQYIDNKNILNTHGGNNMPTIKIKKEMNLPELIEWATENDVRNKSFCSDRYCDEVSFDENKDMTCERITINETFTVEVEEEIARSASIDEMEDIQEYTGEDQAYTTDKLSKKIAAAGTTVKDFKEEVDIITKKLFDREPEPERKDMPRSDVDNVLKEIKRREMRFIKREAQLEEKIDIMLKKYEDMEKIVDMFVGEVLFHRETIAEDTKMYAEKEEKLWNKIAEILSDVNYTKKNLSHHELMLELIDNKYNIVNHKFIPADGRKQTKSNWIKKLFRKQG